MRAWKPQWSRHA